jgi:hypothetical protein
MIYATIITNKHKNNVCIKGQRFLDRWHGMLLSVELVTALEGTKLVYVFAYYILSNIVDES